MPRRPLPRAVQAVKFMAEPWLTYDQAIELVRGRLRGDRSRERALDVLRAALITGEIPMEPAELGLPFKRYGYGALVAC
jgi:hypothetical protein